MTPRAPLARRRDHRGSIAIELAILTPSVLIIFALIFAYGRTAGVNGNLESGTRDAARSATIARTYDDARDRAERIVREAIASTPQACRNTLRVTVSQTFEPGRPLTVTATCSYGLADLGLPGAPGTISPRSSFTSMIDPNRGVG